MTFNGQSLLILLVSWLVLAIDFQASAFAPSSRCRTSRVTISPSKRTHADVLPPLSVLHPDLILDTMATAPSSIHPDNIMNAISSYNNFPSFSNLLVASDASEALTKAAEMSAMDALFRDIFIFLAASVAVVPISRTVNISPVLGFLVIGWAIGPFGLGLLSNTDVDFELGDFGIMFLLFAEGLTLSPDRLKRLTTYSTLGVLQIILSVAFLFFGIIQGGPFLLQYLEGQVGIPLDDRLLRPILESPVEAFCIAAAATLSSSAFVLPVLKEKKWEDLPEGVAGLSILLLQDLAVAPLLVILPLLAGSGPQTGAELGVLIAKATVGFGAVLVVGSYVLGYVFEIVAAARSTETFVAAVLLVAVGMGVAADWLGLSASTGAFAAGLLLASNKYRAQIRADIKPFEGLLLGIFFMTAGANLDPHVVIQEWPTLLTSIMLILVIKAGIIFAEGPVLGLSQGQAARIAFTLAGGGEFAFVLFKMGEDLGVLPPLLAKTLTAAIILSMSLTPLLGEVGANVGKYLDSVTGYSSVQFGANLTPEEADALFDEIDVDNSGTIELDELRSALLERKFYYVSIAEIFQAFDSSGDGVISREEWKAGLNAGILAKAILASEPISKPLSNGNEQQQQQQQQDSTLSFSRDAIVVCGYGDLGRSTIKMLESEIVGLESGDYVAFERNPLFIRDGILAGAPVVYGDAGNIDLFRATGVKAPRAVFVAYASHDRAMEVTEQLRISLPADTPIIARAPSFQLGEELLDAGATDIIVGVTEEALRFGHMLGICDSSRKASKIRQKTFGSLIAREKRDAEILPGLSEGYLLNLADEVGCTLDELKMLHTIFSFSGKGDVPISNLRDDIVRMRLAGEDPMNEDILAKLMDLTNRDGEETLSFDEFVRVSFRQFT